MVVGKEAVGSGEKDVSLSTPSQPIAMLFFSAQSLRTVRDDVA